jgi:hypothetical protein
MASNLASVGNNGIAAGSQPVARSGSDRQAQRDIGDVGKALQSNDVVAAQSAVASLRSAAPPQNARPDFQNAVKALDQALKANDLKGANAALASVQQAQRRAPARQQAPAEETRQLQQDGQAQQVRQREQQDFLTRQDLLAKAASPDQEAEKGRHIDIEV